MAQTKVFSFIYIMPRRKNALHIHLIAWCKISKGAREELFEPSGIRVNKFVKLIKCIVCRCV